MGVSICLNFFKVFVSNIKDDGSKTSHSKNQQTRGISKDRSGRHQREEDEKEEAEGREPRDGNGFRFRRPDADVDETGEEEEGGTGHALLILRPEELGFLRYLKQAKVPLNEYEFGWNKIANIQPQLEKLIEKNYFLNKSALLAYKSYVAAYAAHSLKSVFDINALDLKAAAKAFGFTVPPRVDLRVSASKKSRSGGDNFGYQKKKGAQMTKIFKEVKKRKGDTRQFK